MSLLWISSGSGGGFARTLHQSSPTTLYYDWSWAREKHLYDGLMPQVQSLEEGLHDRPDAVLFEGTGSGDLADRLRKWLPVWGAGEIQDILEENRGFCTTLMHQCGIQVPRTVVFNPTGSSWNPGDTQVQTIQGWVNEAIQFAQKEKNTRWVLKPYESDSSATTYISDGVDDLVDRLKDLQTEHQIPEGSPFVLSEFIEGLELSTEVWIQNGRIIPGSWNNTIELKKFYPGDLGPTVGSTTSTVYFLRNPDSPILQQTFNSKKLQEWLLNPVDHQGKHYHPYHGPLDLNTIISTEGKAYFLEATPRPGWMAYYAMIVNLPTKSLGEIFLRAAQGSLSHVPAETGKYGYELTLSIPPYPTTEEVSTTQHLGRAYREILEPATGIKIAGPLSHPAINWVDVRLNQKTQALETAGTFGQVCSIAVSDKNLNRARDQVNTLFEEIKIPQKQGRVVDGAKRALEYVPQLQHLGFEVP